MDEGPPLTPCGGGSPVTVVGGGLNAGNHALAAPTAGLAGVRRQSGQAGRAHLARRGPLGQLSHQLRIGSGKSAALG